ncbi:hypothetical protein PsorP6_006928 [Peronosclerospora sorghi]|uniref:Uncharacterized protein n=1 Tax=Peronosclerospora sorghi TaxID=230839 RepID=A0ACC0WBR8_9STRA|nr:hypothetical protein PsorP6_006928 [Peronosclerospora sorghi]
MEGKLKVAGLSASKTRDELEKAQAQLTDVLGEKETRETNFGKLWKNIENLQLENLCKTMGVTIEQLVEDGITDVSKNVVERDKAF